MFAFTLQISCVYATIPLPLKNIFFILVIQFFTLSIAHSNEKNPFFDGTMLKIPIVDMPEHLVTEIFLWTILLRINKYFKGIAY
jgi:hypothetical protein